MVSVGVSQRTGEVLIGWDRIVESLRTCLITELGERVQRRDFGARLSDIVDRPQNSAALMNLMRAVQDAIEPRLVNGYWYGEPCFGLDLITVDLRSPGKAVLNLSGVEYPNGHLGDFTPAPNGGRRQATLTF